MPASGSPWHHPLRAGFLIKNQPPLVEPREGKRRTKVQLWGPFPWTRVHASKWMQNISLSSLLPASPHQLWNSPSTCKKKAWAQNHSADSLLSPRGCPTHGPCLCLHGIHSVSVQCPPLFYIFSFPGPHFGASCTYPHSLPTAPAPKQLSSLSRHASTPISHHCQFKSTLEYVLNEFN